MSRLLRNPRALVTTGLAGSLIAAVAAAFLLQRQNPIDKTWHIDWFNILATVVGFWAVVALLGAFAWAMAALIGGADRQLLITKYLRRKLSPLFAALAVMLCTAMVIIVISVMSGFLQMWRDSARRLSGDIMISYGLTGFPHYEAMLAELRKHPDLHAASPIIYTYAVAKLDKRVLKVEVVGIRPGELSDVVDFRDSIHWTAQRIARDRAKASKVSGLSDRELRQQGMAVSVLDLAATREVSFVDGDWRVSVKRVGGKRVLTVTDGQGRMLFTGPVETAADRALIPAEMAPVLIQPRLFTDVDLADAAMTMTAPPRWQTDLPALVAGIAVCRNPRDDDGEYSLFRNYSLGREMTLTVLPLTDSGGFLEQSVRKFVIVNEVKSGFIDYDAGRVYVDFDLLQQMLQMDAADEVDRNTGEKTGRKTPAKTTAILVRGKEGLTLEQVRQTVAAAIRPVVMQYGIEPQIITWEEQNEQVLHAVENEKSLLVFLFTIISMVAFVMVATTFYNIVLEKTRDIGILRAMGASRGGIAGLFLGYGLTIGIVGVIAGFLLAILVVEGLNGIQWFLEHRTGATLFIVLFALWGAQTAALSAAALRKSRLRLPRWLWLGAPAAFALVALAILFASDGLFADLRGRFSLKIWDARIYYFETIPTRIDPREVAVIMFCGVLSSVLGALIPAYQASKLDPVEAIRYE